jgi:thiamine biosynthesis lipoprotein
LPPASNDELTLRRARPLLGTFVEIATPERFNAAIDAAFDAVAQVHGLMSFHEAESDVARLNREACEGPVSVHAWTFEVIAAAAELHRRSAGAFDIAVAPALQDLGLLPRAPTEREALNGTSATSEAIELLPDHRVHFRHPALRIDLGGIAKGFAVDRALDKLREAVPRALVNAGGDLAAFGPQPETVHVRDPRDPGRLLLALALQNQALASSALRFDPLHSTRTAPTAVIDPRAGTPVEAIIAATVRAPSCMVADALTKVVMVAGTDAAPVLEHYGAGALMMSADGHVQMTEDMAPAVTGSVADLVTDLVILAA